MKKEPADGKKRRTVLIAAVPALILAALLLILCRREHISFAADDDAEALNVIETFPTNGAKDVFSTSGIEIRFDSDAVSPGELEDYVSFSPSVDFYTGYGAEDDTLVIYPFEHYKPETLYTVTVKAGFSDDEGRVLKEDVSFSFSTAAEALEKYYGGMFLAGAGSGVAVNALTDETPAFFLIMDQEIAGDFEGGPEAAVTLYRFADRTGFANALVRRIEAMGFYNAEKDKDYSEGEAKELYSEFTLKAELMDEEYWWWGSREYVMSFPESLPEGQYIAQFDFSVDTGNQTAVISKYLLIQSTGLSVYCMNSGEDTLAWVHDSETGEALTGASVRIYGGYDAAAGVTDETGVAALSKASFEEEQDTAPEKLLPESTGEALDSYFHFLEVEQDGRSFIDAISENRLFANDYFYRNQSDLYYTYIMTDRTIYHPTDEIRFYGVVKPRYAETKMPESLEVMLGESWWSDDEITSVTVTPDENGVFEGTLSFEDQQAASYISLTVYSDGGDTLMYSDPISILGFEKPVYTSEATLDKPVYVLGQDRDTEALLNINVSYFDGTPAEDYAMEVEWYTDGITPQDVSLTADEKGNMTTALTFNAAAYENSWQPNSASISYRSSEAEDEVLYVSAEPMVIPRDVILQTENDRENHTLNVTTHAVDVSGITERKDLFNTDNFRGEGLSKSVEATLVKCWYERISEGIKYDYIYKRSYEAFRYEFHEDTVGRYTIETTDGEGSFVYELEEDEATSPYYYVDLRTEDSAGMPVERRTYLSLGSWGGYRYYSEDTYELSPVQVEAAAASEEDYWESPYYSTNLFNEDGPAKFELMLNGEPFEIPEGGELLTAAAAKKFLSVETGAARERDIAFDETLVPNYQAVGAYFDGRNTWPLQPTRMTFDADTRALEIAIEGDKETYLPGDTVNISIDLKKAANGEAVPAGTPVVLSVVDEAVFALSDQSVDILHAIYRNFWTRFSSYSSKNNLNADESSLGYSKASDNDMVEMDEAAPTMAAAEGGMLDGGGAEEHIRSEFKDTAYFEVAYTDETGRAAYSFTIPDNMTAWRFTAAAVTSDVFAGSQTKDFVCSKPYYTVPVLNDLMLSGDTFGIGLRSAGTIDSAACSYEISIRPADSDEIVLSGAGSGESFRDYVNVVLGTLEEGEYIVQIKGSCGDCTDISEYPFTVLRSGLEAYASVTMPLSELTELHPLRYPVDYMIFDKNAAVYHSVLADLACSREIRADERIASYYAMTLMAEESDYWKERLKETDISDLTYIFPNFPYAKANAELSALAYLAAADILPTDPVYGIYPEDIGQSLDSPYAGSPYAAYLMAALTGDGFAEDPAVLLADPALAFRDRVYLAASLILTGDTETANAFYDETVLPRLETAEAVSGEVVTSVNIDEGTTAQDDTAAALILAALLDRDEAEGFASFLVHRESDKDIYPLEEMLYLVYNKPEESAECAVRYTLDGETAEKTLKAYEKLHLSLQKAELEALNPEVISGEPYVTVFYICGAEDLTDESTKKLSVTAATDKTVYAVGDTAAITLTPHIGDLDPTLGSSTMILDVYIPSGMRFERFTPDTRNDRFWYLSKREGQRLRFVLYDGSDDRHGDFAPITFYASCVTPGDYIVEKAYLSSNYYDTWGISERSTVTIE